MLPIPDSRVFRSRKGAIWWSFWVIMATVMTVGFADPDPQPTNAAADTDLQAIAAILNAR